MDIVSTVVWAVHAKAIELRDIYHEEDDICFLTSYQMEVAQKCADLVWEPGIGCVSKFYMLFLLWKMGYYEDDPQIERCVEGVIPILEKMGLIFFNPEYGYYEVA